MTGDAVPLLVLSVRVERDIFAVRQRGREVAAAVGLEYQDQIRVATALSEVGRQLLLHGGGAQVAFQAPDVGSPTLLVEMTSRGPLPAGGQALAQIAAVRRLVDAMEVADAEAGTVVRMSRRIPPGVPRLTASRMDEVRADLAALPAGAPLDKLTAQNEQLITALDELRAQRDDLARLNAELQETNQGVMALYNQLSAELEETNRGVVALYADLDEKSAQLNAANEAKSRFLANVSHELRAPVTAIIGLGRLLTDPASDPMTEEQSRQVELIRGCAGDLLALVNELLDLAKAEAGRLEPTWTDVDLRAVFGQLRGTLRPLLTRAEVELVVDDPEPGVTVRSDEVLLAQVLRNLLTNALKFTDHGAVRLAVRWPDDGRQVELVVSDTGVGIPAELHDRIFEEFYQVPGSSTGRAAGTGLGLPYARRLVDLLGGTLTLDSEPGRGSVFTVLLPVGNGPRR